jgi:hypothetical protein
MRIVYRAANIVDAHLVRGVLETHGIRAFVTGEFLTGGAGELPAAGLVSVMVSDHDILDAERLLTELRHTAEPLVDDEIVPFVPSIKPA